MIKRLFVPPVIYSTSISLFHFSSFTPFHYAAFFACRGPVGEGDSSFLCGAVWFLSVTGVILSEAQHPAGTAQAASSSSSHQLSPRHLLGFGLKALSFSSFLPLFLPCTFCACLRAKGDNVTSSIATVSEILKLFMLPNLRRVQRPRIVG